LKENINKYFNFEVKNKEKLFSAMVSPTNDRDWERSWEHSFD